MARMKAAQASLAGVVLAVTLCALTGVSWAKSKPMPLTHIPSQTTATSQLPDLAVVGVRLDSSCDIEVKLRNAGQVAIDQRFLELTKLRIRQGRRQKDFALGKVVPTGGLRKPGSSYVFKSGRAANGEVPVYAELIFSRKLRDLRKANNRARTPKGMFCRVPAAKPPALVVQDALLKKGRLHLVLNRNLKVKLSPKDKARGTLLVTIKGKSHSIPLSRALKTGRIAKGLVIFNTRIKVTPPGKVLVTLRLGSKVTRGKFTLPSGTTAVRTTKPRHRSRIRGTARLPGRAAMMMAQVRRGGGSSAVPRLYDAGLRITTPTEGQRFFSGATLRVGYSFSREVAEGDIVFHLYADGTELDTATVHFIPFAPHDPGDPVPVYPLLMWRLPSDAPESTQYYIIGVHNDGWGISDRFTVAHITDGGGPQPGGLGLRVAAPRGGEAWTQSSNRVISWRMMEEYPSGEPRFTVTLMRGAAPVLTIPSERVHWTASARTFTLPWQVPGDLAPGDSYRIRVQDRNGPAEAISANPFSIIGPIEFLSGSMPDVLYISNNKTLRWRISDSSIANVRIAVVNDSGEEVFVIKERQPASSGSYVWRVGADSVCSGVWYLHQFWGHTPTPVMGDNLRFRVSAHHDSSIHDQSRSFAIRMPVINVSASVLPGDGTLGHKIRIIWSAPTLDGSQKMLIEGQHGSGWVQKVVMRHDQPVSGSVDWLFGDVSAHRPDEYTTNRGWHSGMGFSGHWPREFPCSLRVVVGVHGFFMAVRNWDIVTLLTSR